MVNFNYSILDNFVSRVRAILAKLSGHSQPFPEDMLYAPVRSRLRDSYVDSDSFALNIDRFKKVCKQVKLTHAILEALSPKTEEFRVLLMNYKKGFSVISSSLSAEQVKILEVQSDFYLNSYKAAAQSLCERKDICKAQRRRITRHEDKCQKSGDASMNCIAHREINSLIFIKKLTLVDDYLYLSSQLDILQHQSLQAQTAQDACFAGILSNIEINAALLYRPNEPAFETGSNLLDISQAKSSLACTELENTACRIDSYVDSSTVLAGALADCGKKLSVLGGNFYLATILADMVKALSESVRMGVKPLAEASTRLRRNSVELNKAIRRESANKAARMSRLKEINSVINAIQKKIESQSKSGMSRTEYDNLVGAYHKYWEIHDRQKIDNEIANQDYVEDLEIRESEIRREIHESSIALFEHTQGSVYRIHHALAANSNWPLKSDGLTLTNLPKLGDIFIACFEYLPSQELHRLVRTSFQSENPNSVSVEAGEIVKVLFECFHAPTLIETGTGQRGLIPPTCLAEIVPAFTEKRLKSGNELSHTFILEEREAENGRHQKLKRRVQFK